MKGIFEYQVLYHLNPQNLRNPCPGVSGNITQYQISFLAENVAITETVTVSECMDGRCNLHIVPASHLLNSSVPLSYRRLAVAAENVVGVGAARTCTTQTISKLTLLDSNIVARKSTV